MRGAWESYFEYIPELHTESIFIQIGCDGLAHVIEAGVLSDTHGDRQCELLMNKGGNTSLTLVLLWDGGFFCTL